MATNPVIRGTDGAIPQYDPEARWTTWHIDEIYLGGIAHLKYVPKIKDYVIDTINKRTFIVTSINDLLIPTLQDINSYNGEELVEDVIVGPSIGRQSETYRVYIDDSTIPHTMAVDARVKIYGSMCTYARLFRGTDISISGEVLSVIFDNGRYLDDKVLLELAQYDSHDIVNHTVKSVPSCHTDKKIKDGELVTLVIYNSIGKVVSKKTLIAENTSYIRSVNADQKYISHIGIETPFIDPVDTKVIKYPINVPVASLNIYGLVYYSDGSIRKLPVDNTKFRLLGLEKFVSTVVGQEVPLVLSYRLDKNETVYGSVSSDGHYVTEPFTLLTDVENGVFTPKLYGYPEWNRVTNQYQLKWYLMDLKRDILLDVSSYVHFNETSDVWNGNEYNTIQNLSIRINLADISPAFPDYIHTQTLNIVLRKPFTEEGTKYEIGFEPNQKELYGTNLKAVCQMVNQNYWKVNIKNNISNMLEWVDKLYLNTKPVYSIRREERPLTPTHFAIVIDEHRFEHPLSDWDKTLVVSTNLDLKSNVYVEFLKEVNNGNKLKLSVAGLPIERL